MIKVFLKDIDLFKSLTQSELELLFTSTKERFYKKGQVIVSEGNKTDSIYIVKDGKVKLFKTSSDEKTIILDIKGSSSVFCISMIFSDLPNPSTITTIEDSTIYVLNISDIESIVLNNPHFSLDIIKILSYELVEAQDKIKSLALDDSYVKVIKLILNLSRKYGIDISENSIELDLVLTRSEMADVIGSSRETVSRAISQLSKQNLINFDEKRIIIKDKAKLEGWLK